MVIDALVSEAVFRDGLVLRLATVGPLTVLGLVAANLGWSRIVTLCLGASPVAFVGVVAHLTMHMPIQHAALYLNATALVIGIANITLPFTLRGLAVVNIAAIAAVTASVAVFGADLLRLHNGSLVVLTLVAAATLVISHRFERMRRHNFLLNLHARATSRELLEANRQLEDLSNRDPLTGLPNRRFFNRMFDITVDEMRSVPGSGELRHCQIALLMIDLDHFKAFNDTHGHMAGDEALRIVGHELSSILQSVDGIAARYGGEEFVAAFSAQTVKEAEVIAEDIRSTIASLLVPIWPSGRSIITTSVGIAFAAAGESPERDELIATADDALYIAKRSGRNRVETITLGVEPIEATG